MNASKTLPVAICLIAVALSMTLTGSLRSEPAAAARPGVRFAFVNVYVDSGDAPLAAWQCELTEKTGAMRIVGVEGGDHPAFKRPPHYDPAALQRSRVIVAAFNTGKDLPRGKTRVARVHVQITGEGAPDYSVKLTAAASADGKRIDAKVSHEQGAAQ